MKENDIILNMIANPKFTLEDFSAVGLNSNNTGLQSEDKYLESDKIKSVSAFQDANGQFDKNKFHDFYQAAGGVYNQMSDQDYEKTILAQAQFSKDNIWVNPQQRTVDYTPRLVKVANPTLTTNSLEQMGQRGKQRLSTSEIAQTQAVVDPITGKKSASPNDSFFSNLFNTLVLASYDKDEVDPNTGEVLHHKGDLKYNEDGLPYYEKLAGRDVSSKQVLNKMNTLTTDGSAWNKFDFFDSDGIDQKSTAGTVLKNAALVGSMFIPYVGPVITGLSVATQATGLLATLGKVIVGNDNKTLNNIQGWAKTVNRQSTTEYAQQHTWCMENFINMIGDTVGQLAEQRWIFKAAAVPFEGLDAWKAMSKTGYEALKAKKAAELTKEATLTTDKLMSEALNGRNLEEYVAKYIQTQRAITDTRAAKYVDDLVKRANQIGSPISKAYMTGITVQDTYGEAKNNGASDLEAALLTIGYAGGEAWILNKGLGELVLPELHMEKFRNKAIAEAFVKPVKEAKQALAETGDKQGFVRRMLQIGKNAATNAYAEKALMGKSAQVIGAHALGEAFEEVSEEALADASKGIFNALRWLQGKNSINWWEGDNWLDRYAMSGFGGFVGGGLNSAATNFRQIKNLSGMTSEQAMQQLIYMANNDQLGEFMSDVDKMTLGDKNKSATKTISNDKNGVWYAEGTEDDNQDLAAHQVIRNQVKFINDILTTHGAKLSTDSLLSKLSMTEQQDVLKNIRVGNLARTNVAGMYAQDYQKLQADLIRASAELRTIDDAIGDVKSKATPEQQKARAEKAAEVDGYVGRIKEYLNGTISPDFIRDAVFEINPLINTGFITPTIEQFVKAKTGKDISQLADSELETYKTQFKDYMNGQGKMDTHAAAIAYQDMMTLATPIVQQMVQLVQQSKQSPEVAQFNQFVNNYLGTLTNLDTTSQEGFQSQAQSLTDTSGARAMAAMMQPFLTEDQKNRWAYLDEELAADPNLSFQQKEERNQIIVSALETNISNYVNNFIKLGYINPEVRTMLLEGLTKFRNTYATHISDSINNLDPADPDYKTQMKELTKKSADFDKQVIDMKKQINALPSTPVIDFIDKFKSSSTNSTLNFSEHWKNTLDMLNNNKTDISEFGLEDNWDENNQEALKIIRAFRAVLNGMRNDNADLDNPTGYAKILNTIYQKSAQQNYAPLAEINAQEADMMLEDINKLLTRLEYADTLSKINRGQKLKEQNKVAARKNQLIYSSTQRLLNTLSDSDWDKDSIDVLKATFDSATDEVKDALTSDSTKFDRATRAAVEKYMLSIDNAIYDFFEKNKDASGKLSDAKIQNLLKKFAGNAGFFQKTHEILNEGTKVLDDNAYIWYLASRAALKAQKFFGSYKASIKDDVAPVASQELATYLGVAAVTNMDTLNQFVDAYRNTVIQEFNNLDEKSRTDLLNQFDTSGEAYSKDLLKYFGSHDVLPQYHNMIFVEGIAGSGKSKAVFRNVIRTINTIDPDYLKSAYFVHETESSAKASATDLELDENNAFGRVQFLQKLSNQWKDFRENTEKGKDGKTKAFLYEDSYKFDDTTGRLENTWALNKMTDAPKVVFIDEISHYNQQEVSMIEQWARENGVVVLTAGDFDQDTAEAWAKKVTYKGDPVSVTLNRNNFVRSPKLGVSLRTANKQLTQSTRTLQAAISEVLAGKQVALNLNYLDSDPSHVGLFGVKIKQPKDTNKGLSNDELKDIEKTIDLMVQTTGNEKIGYIYHSEDTALYKLLTTKYADKIEKFKDSDAQGLEGKYYIVENDINPNIDDLTYLRSLYTGVTRASQGVLAITPASVKQITAIESTEDKKFQLETIGAEAIKQSVEERLEQLDNMVEDSDAIDSINAPTYSAPTTPPKKKGGLPPTPPPPTPPTGGSSVTSQADAQLEVEKFKKKIINPAGNIECEAQMNSTGIKFDIVEAKAVENSGSWVPTIVLHDRTLDYNFEVSLENFNKGYSLLKIDDGSSTPIYTQDQSFVISGNEQVTIKEVIPGSPIKYQVIKADGSEVTMEESDLQSQYTGEIPTPPITPPDNTVTTGLENESQQSYEQMLSEANAVSEVLQQTGTIYSMSTYMPGMKNDNGKAVFDDNSPEGTLRQQQRIDGFLGLSKVLDADDWNTLDQYFAYCRNALFTETDNAKLVADLKNRLGLTGTLDIRYGLKSTAGRRTYKDAKYYRYDQGEEEKCLYHYSEDEDADQATRKKIVGIIFQDGKPILEIPCGILNSPITILNYTDDQGNYIHGKLRDTYLNYIANNPGDSNAEYDARQEVIAKFDGSGIDQDVVDLFKVYRCTSNALFLFDKNWNLASQSSTGIHLVGAKGARQNNGQFQTSNKFINIAELASNPQFRISRILTSKTGQVANMPAVNAGHSFVLVGDSNNYQNTADLVKQFEKQCSDPNEPEKVHIYYVMPPRASVSDWMNNQHNLYLNKVAGSASHIVYDLGNDFTGYRILKCLWDQRLLDSILSIGSTAQGYRSGTDVLNHVKSLLGDIKNIEDKWKGTLNLDDTNKIDSKGEKEFYNQLIQLGYTDEDARKTLSIHEVNQYLHKPLNNMFQAGRTVNQVLNAYLTCMVWNRSHPIGSNEVITEAPGALQQIEGACQNAQEPITDIFYKAQYSTTEHGSFNEIQQDDNWNIRSASGNGSFQINARIDTPNFNSDSLPIARIAGEIVPKQVTTTNGKTVTIWAMSDEAKKKYENVYLGKSKLQNKPDPVDELVPYKNRLGLTDNELVRVVSSGNNKVERLRTLCNLWNSKDSHNWGFLYNGEAYFTTNDSIDNTNLTAEILDTDNYIVLSPDHSKKTTFIFTTRADGTISGVNASVTTYKKVEATTSSVQVDENDWNNAVQNIVGTLNKQQQNMSILTKPFAQITTAQGKRQLKTYLKTAKSLAKRPTLAPEQKKAWQSIVSYIETMVTGSTPTISLENDDYVIWNSKRYKVIDASAMLAEDVDTKVQITLSQDELYKEETACTPIPYLFK